MGKIVAARAYANNEVAYVAWDIDGRIPGCLGFEVTRVYLNSDDTVARRADGSEDRVKCAAWVAFKGQKNPNWLPQDTGVWPVQKLSWRDLTLRKKRDGAIRRPDNVRVRYEVRPVGDLQPGLTPVTPGPKETGEIVRRDAKGVPILLNGKRQYDEVKAFTGKKRLLGYLADATMTNPVAVTSHRPPFRSTFTNGILAAQWLSNVLRDDDGKIGKDELIQKLADPDDVHRKYLAGDVIPLIYELFKRKGEFHLSLYELEDEELEQILVDNADRIHVILSNTALGEDKKTWDTRNAAARKRLVKAKVDVQHRMFNNSIHIGHNKFVVHLDEQGNPQAVLTGSTNWTATGLAGQTNNALLIEDPVVAATFLDYWTRMKADKLKVPKPLGAATPDAQQSKLFRKDNETATVIPLSSGGVLTTWFSPNMQARKKPTSKTKPAAVPPDLQHVYRLMRQAKQAILFLAFYPGMSGRDCVIGEVIKTGELDRSLLIGGVVSSAQAMPNYRGKEKDEDGEIVDEGESPTTYTDQNISIVRASKIDDKRILGDFGAEQLTARGAIGAIVHDKLIVIDPRSDDCHVVLGSHNLGYKASYSNDENLVVVSREKALAEAYAVHILDVYDHYRFRAIETERRKQGKPGWSGFLDTGEHWQDGYVSQEKGALMRYFAR